MSRSMLLRFFLQPKQQARLLRGLAFDLDGRELSVTSPEGTISYTYDEATGWHTGTITSFNNTVSGNLSYTYDGFGRLSKITTVMRGGNTPSAGSEYTTYSYRPTGVVDQVFTSMYGTN